MPTAPQPLAPIDPAATGGELVVAAAAALEPDGNAPVGSARTWRVACAGCGRRGYRLLERHAHGLVPASARRCACGSARFEPLAPRARRHPGGDPPGAHRSDPAAPPASDGDHTPLAGPAGGGRLQAPSFAQHLDGARSWAGNALAPATRAAYARAWRHFRAWCARHHRPSLPADAATVAAYLDAHTRPRRYQTTTIQLRLTAIGHVHRLAGVGDPTADEQVRVVWKGIRRDPAAPAVSPAKAATGRVLRQVLAAFPDAPLLTVDDAGGNGQADDDTPGGLAADELRERALSDLRGARLARLAGTPTARPAPARRDAGADRRPGVPAGGSLGPPRAGAAHHPRRAGPALAPVRRRGAGRRVLAALAAPRVRHRRPAGRRRPGPRQPRRPARPVVSEGPGCTATITPALCAV